MFQILVLGAGADIQIEAFLQMTEMMKPYKTSILLDFEAGEFWNWKQFLEIQFESERKKV